MYLKSIKLGTLVAVVLFGSAVARSEWFSWESRAGLSYEQVVTLASEMATRGYAPTRIESNVENGELRFATIWIKEQELAKQRWQFGVRLNADALQRHVDDVKAKGFAPVDVAVATVAGQPVFSMISGTGALNNWQLRHGLTAREVITRTDEYARSGLDLIDINAYPTETGMRFAAIWGDAGFDGQVTEIAVTESQFQRQLERLPAGFVPFNVNVGSIGDETVYSGIFVKDDEHLYDVRYGLTEAQLQAYFDRQVDAGFAPHALAAYNIKLQPKYAAVFAKKRQTEVKANPVFTVPDIGLPTGTRRVLEIPPVYQQTKVWCWLAVGEMVFRHYGVRNNNTSGNFQCGIIGTIMSDTECYSNCFNARCIRGSGSNYATVKMLKDYAWMSSRRVLSASETYELPFAAIKANIDAGRPIIAGVSPTRRQYYEGAEHVALIVGYEAGPGGVHLIVNDPFPYPPMGNPYTRNGARAVSDYQYRIPMLNFTRDLFWHWSIHNISVE